ncbi:23477_t:CDS:2 [Cetraspora pellucida]|uniref:23477_t:CDS:1 n=1 Tax=Cetraspora pellucida TaxID=1433469 RepID=A0A9N9A2L8_9GLOM|nr:23477_t:CDS:2 [Cetraspora pellucida]
MAHQQDIEATKWGEQTFGGHNFHKEHGHHSTDVLETKMKQRKHVWLEDDQSTQIIEYLFPREWYYFFRIENTSNRNITVTFRVFVVPIDLCNSFNEWIEIDKFKQENCRTVVARDCDHDTAITAGTKDKESDEELTKNNIVTADGHSICDWEKDKVPQVTRCGSLSFCGAERPQDKYPDVRPMGYPFDRPFKDCSFEKTFAGLHNTASKDVTIHWVDNYPDWCYSLNIQNI